MPLMAIMAWAVAQGPAAFMARVAAQIRIFKALKEIKVGTVSNLAKEVSSSNRGDTRPIQSSSMAGSIMCLLPVCASEIRSFIKGL